MMVKEAGREARTGITQEDARKGRAGVAVETERPFEEHATRNLPVVGGWLAGKLYGTAKNAVPDGSRYARGRARRSAQRGLRERGRRDPAAPVGLGPPAVAPRASERRVDAVSRSAQMVVVAEQPVVVVLDPQIRVRTGLRDPVDPVIAPVGKLVAGERRPVAVPETPQQRAGEAGPRPSRRAPPSTSGPR